MRVKISTVIGTAAIIGLGVSLAIPKQETLIWNRTQSAPIGLYLRQSSPPDIGDWAILSGQSDTARWISDHGFIGPGWPVIKRVVASSGDEICRYGDHVSINGVVIADAISTSESGLVLPVWRGCQTLLDDQFLLINAHKNSVDGRYFGPENQRDIKGSARLLWRADK